MPTTVEIPDSLWTFHVETDYNPRKGGYDGVYVFLQFCGHDVASKYYGADNEMFEADFNPNIKALDYVDIEAAKERFGLDVANKMITVFGSL